MSVTNMWSLSDFTAFQCSEAVHEPRLVAVMTARRHVALQKIYRYHKVSGNKDISRTLWMLLIHINTGTWPSRLG
jgi:hypothetical protein